MRKSPLWLRVVVIGGMLWGAVLLIGSTKGEPTPSNVTYMMSILGSGLYTLILYLLRPLWLPSAARHPLRSAMIVGIINAAVEEILFWTVEHAMGVTGIAASENLLLDLALTMPWYIGMVILFVGGQNRQRFSTVMVLLLGGIYELGGDGVVGGVVGALISGTPVDVGQRAVFLIAVALWEFIFVYSSMVLPSAWVIAASPPPETVTIPAWRDALRPLLWLIPFSVYLTVVFLVLIRVGYTS